MDERTNPGPRLRGASGAARGEQEPVRLGQPGERLPAAATLVTEEGDELGAVTTLPRDLPFGYHRLVSDDGEQLLIVAPERCPRPQRRAWGWAAQLYAVRSAASWGIGDLANLRDLGRWSSDHGAGFLLLNPLHAATPVVPWQPSPYFPSTRRFRDPPYLRIEDVPGAAALGERLRGLAAAGHGLNGERRIDRDRVAALKLAALDELWRARPRDAHDGLAAYRADQGEPLNQWALFCTAAEVHGGRWASWPAALRDREPAAMAAFAAEHAHRLAFHAWLQWLLDEQLGRATESIGLIADLAVGFAPDGFDAWSWRQHLAADTSIGAPPDAFNPLGQVWNLPPFDPQRLRAAGYRPFIETLRAVLRRAAGIRIDHVMGLFRLWWVANGADPKLGRYVRYPAGELLAIVALEAHRANALVIGEDLGTVEPEVRGALARRGILSYRLMLFEGTDAGRYPELALAAITTHDLPTVAGLWTGADLRQQRAAGLEPNEAGARQLRATLAELASAGASADEVILAAHARLAGTPSLLVSATLEDALRVEERPNLPGTTEAQAANWSLALPRSLEEIEADPLVGRLATALHR
ncbi:MAG TPA: 4-alpha-glucanotransferase [Candidatus Limnocylindria bacterium]|nr:4-alpha-glucanotransferase [Candidatus Limnocylindria bacterium]